MSFVHLHVASAFSSHYGVTRPELLAEAASSLGMTALAITDRDGLYGAVKHIGACQTLGISPIVGVELSVVDDEGAPLARCVILARGHDNGMGWATLCSIVSAAHGYNVNTALTNRGRKQDRIAIRRGDLARLIGESVGACTVLLGNDSDVGRSVLAGTRDEAIALLGPWQELFAIPNSLAIEVTSLLTEPGVEHSVMQASRMLQLADASGLPSALTNAVRYLTPDDAVTADVLDAARFLEPLGFFQTQPNAQAWLKPAEVMHALAEEITGDSARARKLIEDTQMLANRFRLEPLSDCGWGKPKTPEKSALGIEGNPFEVLWQKTEAGINWRYPTASGKELVKIQHRLNQELITINQLGFATYFLTVADVAQMIRDMNIRIAARGSGAGSLVNYLLGISGVDPIEHDLLFERFLSTERSSLPDIDIDVESARRHDIYRNIFKRYGSNRVTLLSMQSTYRGRGAVRDSGLALGIDEDEIDQIAKSVWRLSAGSFRNAVGQKPELGMIAEALESDRKMNLLVDITERLNRLPRHISMHPCGVILGDSSLLKITSIEPSGMGLPMSQFDKDDMDPMGLLKLDVLGVRMQSAMAYAVKEIRRTANPQFDLDAVDRADAETFKSIRTTNTLGIFQIESPGQRELTGKHQPTAFNDLTIQISLFRPGPMKGNMIAPYLDGRHGFASADFIHKDLEPILRETFGVVIFHEHVLRIFNVMTGCTLARADEMRRSLEDPRLKPRIEEFFRTKTKERGYSPAVIQRVWEILEGFSSFGFCKAHAAAFALPTYQSAWLKTHYPAAFFSGVLTHDPGMYPKRLMLDEVRRMDIPIAPLDINRSDINYRTNFSDTSHRAIRIALSAISGASSIELASIKEGQPYIDLADFYRRSGASLPTIETLILTGALDEIHIKGDSDKDITHRDLLLHLADLQKSTAPALSGAQLSLGFAPPALTLSGLPAMGREEKISNELTRLGMDITDHLLSGYAPFLNEIGAIRSCDLLAQRNNTSVLLAGVKVALQSPPIRSGTRVLFLTLDDGYGCSDSTFFPDVLASDIYAQTLQSASLFLVRGTTRRTGKRGISIRATGVWDLATAYDKRQARGSVAI